MSPPFLREDSLIELKSLYRPNQDNAGELLDKPRSSNLPAVFQNKESKTVRIRPDSLREYIKLELDVSRLNDIHEWLWMAGRPMCARPLCKQKMLGRDILVTEQMDIHLLWQETQIFIKPLPEFLMDHAFWTENLCDDVNVHRNACGLLLSYTWLVCYQSDLKIAKDHGLLPTWMTWVDWISFIHAVLDAIDYESLSNVNERYQYGEIRLFRVNWIYRLTLRSFVEGYMYRYNRFSVFLSLNFAWLAVALLYITVVLSAMQVGLATDQLKGSSRFQNASYGFTIFSILTPVIVGTFVIFVLLVLVYYNVQKSFNYMKKVEQRRRQPRQNKVQQSSV